MHYLLSYEKAPDWSERQLPLVGAHRDHIRLAVERGELLLGGNLHDPEGAAMLLFSCDSPQQVEDFARADPYVTEKIVVRWTVRPWETVVGTLV